MMKLYSLILVLVLIIETTKSQIICSPEEDCIIDCSSIGGSNTCSNSIIDATGATSLILLCNEERSCEQTNIYTPNSTNSTTTIECTGSIGCYLTNIYYLGDATSNPSTHSINIICFNNGNLNGACQYTKIDVSNAGIILTTVGILQK